MNLFQYHSKTLSSLGRCRLRSCLYVCVLGAYSLSLVGCGSSDRPKTIPVSGNITFAGETPEHPGALFFAPLEGVEGYPRRGGRALFETDGVFSATSFETGDGLVPGTYKVRIESWKKPPSMGAPGVSYIPKGFEPEDIVVSEKEKSIRYDVDISAK